METLTPPAALIRALDALGSQAALAALCGVTQPAVWKWVRLNKALPAEHVIKVEKELKRLGHQKPDRFDLRPDLYPRESGDDQADPIDLEPAR